MLHNIKAIIRKGKFKGKEVEISQWCNDWFMVRTGNIEIDRKPFSPSALAFEPQGMEKILKHKNNGMFLAWFEPTDNVGGFGKYFMSFKRKKYGR